MIHDYLAVGKNFLEYSAAPGQILYNGVARTARVVRVITGGPADLTVQVPEQPGVSKTLSQVGAEGEYQEITHITGLGGATLIRVLF